MSKLRSGSPSFRPPTPPHPKPISSSASANIIWGTSTRLPTAFKATAERVPLTEVLNNIGAAENRRGHQRDAADYFQKAVAADPSDPDYHFNLAVALYRKGDLTGAQRQLRETLNRRPNDTEARQFQESLAASPAASSPASPAASTAASSAASAAATAVHPVPITLPLPRIKRNYDESSYRQLAVELQNAIEASIGKAKPSARATLHVERAREFLANGAVSEAENQFREALTQEPANANALSGLAHALLLQNKFSQARHTAATALGLHPSAEAYLVIARADLHDNNSDAARQNLQKALALEPNSDDAKALAQDIQSRTSETDLSR